MKLPKITVLNNNGRCILSFRYLGERYSITQGDYANPADRENMEALALQIKADMRNGTFDGMERYKSNPKSINKERIIDLIEANLNDVNLKGLLKWLRLYQCPIRGKAELAKFFSYMPLVTSTKRRYYTALRAFPEIKPFCEFEIKAPKGEARKEIDPFTVAELQSIRKAFRGNHYSLFVDFMVFTGCRPSEAIGIQWEDIEFENRRVRFHRSLSKNQITGKREYKTTKTGKSRYTPLTAELHEKLDLTDWFREKVGLVFTTTDGTAINDSNFLSRVWVPALDQAGVRYRPPYNLRHTFISHCMIRGVDVVTVASWVGNSPKVIWEHYAGLVSDREIPDLYPSLG